MAADDDPGARPEPPRQVDKPWGYEIIWADTDLYVGKILHIESGHQLSFQYHRFKDETIHVLRGRVELDLDEPAGGRGTVQLAPGTSYRIRPEVRHRLRAIETSDVLEASTAELDDVVRLEDDYGRVGT